MSRLNLVYSSSMCVTVGKEMHDVPMPLCKVLSPPLWPLHPSPPCGCSTCIYVTTLLCTPTSCAITLFTLCPMVKTRHLNQPLLERLTTPDQPARSGASTRAPLGWVSGTLRCILGFMPTPHLILIQNSFSTLKHSACCVRCATPAATLLQVAAWSYTRTTTTVLTCSTPCVLYLSTICFFRLPLTS